MPSSPPTAADRVRSQLAHLLAAWLVAEVRKEAEGQAREAVTVESPTGLDRPPVPATPRSRARRPRRVAGAKATAEGR
jgi:hypothetical protein